jgi:hypothetical protein
VGAKQNRILNLTILVPAGQTLIIPVSCVEQGRWATRSAAFSSSKQTMYAMARKLKTMAVSDNLMTSGSRAASQGDLWMGIAEKASRMRSASDTGAMSDLYENHSRRIEEYETAFGAVAGQTGALFAIGDQVVGLDLFEHDSLLETVLPKLVRSYALDAIDRADNTRPAGSAAARDLLDRVASADVSSYAGIGLGTDLRLRGKNVTGAGLALGDRLVHVAAFHDDDQAPDGTTSPGRRGNRIVRASRRRQS